MAANGVLEEMFCAAAISVLAGLFFGERPVRPQSLVSHSHCPIADESASTRQATTGMDWER